MLFFSSSYIVSHPSFNLSTGSIELKVGFSKSKLGGDVKLEAGEAKGKQMTGGDIELAAGASSSLYGGRGGDIRIGAGRANGMIAGDNGGDLMMTSGPANGGSSGDVWIGSGLSEEASSGAIGELIQ